MLRVTVLILWLTLLPAAFRAEIPGDYISVSGSVLESYGQREILSQVLPPEPAFGSLTGFIDFSQTDALLRYLDEYVMASLQSHDLRSMLHVLVNFAMPEIREPGLFYLPEEAASAVVP